MHIDEPLLSEHSNISLIKGEEEEEYEEGEEFDYNIYF